MKKTNKPVQKIQTGAVSASIWRENTRKGVMFNVTFQRTYKDGDKWRNSSSFGRKDLLVIGFLAARAFEWIASQPQKTKTAVTGSQQSIDVPL